MLFFWLFFAHGKKKRKIESAAESKCDRKRTRAEKTTAFPDDFCCTYYDPFCGAGHFAKDRVDASEVDQAEYDDVCVFGTPVIAAHTAHVLFQRLIEISQKRELCLHEDISVR